MTTPVNPLDKLFDNYQNTKVLAVSVAAISGGQVLTNSTGCTKDTLFQAASISKAVAALTALILVQEKKLALDEDVNTKLVSWKLPPPQDPTITDPVTLRDLLSHGGGISVQSFPGYPNGTTVLPNLTGILEGRTDTLNCPVRRRGKPGQNPDYSGGGYMVLQQLIQDTNGGKQTFAELVKEKVFDKLGMTSAGYDRPDPLKVAKGRVGDKEIPDDGWREYPELAAAGVWCTPTDLVRFAAGIQAALANEPTAVLSQPLAEEMIRPRLKNWGLGVQRQNGYFLHSGQNEGYNNELFATVKPGPVVAIMTASDHGSAEIHRLVPLICTKLLPNDPPFLPSSDPNIIPPSFSDQAALDYAYAGNYQIGTTPDTFSLKGRGLRWVLTLPDGKTELIEPISAVLASSPTLPLQLIFTIDPKTRRATQLTVSGTGTGQPISATRK